MAGKRALIVDDSRSARAFLTRVLERYDLAVDGVESAEQAIEYLAHQRPDVIFMDHLMPGMDGFQAVQAIKTNPRTATIPIMMYTSQEGELYLSQARALGAIGVLPKQIRHADVSRALEQLRLIDQARPESEFAAAPPRSASARAQPDAAAVRPAAQALRAAEPSPVVSAPLRYPSDAGDQQPPWMELRRFVTHGMENMADHIVEDIRALLQDGAAVGAPARSRRSGALAWTVAAMAVAAAVVLAVQWQRSTVARADLATALADTRAQLATAKAALALQPGAAAPLMHPTPSDAAAAAPALPAAVQDGADLPGETDTAGGGAADDTAAGDTADESALAGPQLIQGVPFGETPLAGARLERIQTVLGRLTAQGFRGTVQIRSFPGRFCLISTGDSFVIPDSDIPYSRCDQIGNPRDDSMPGLRESTAFANMIAAARSNSNGALDIQVSNGGPDETLVPYPTITDTLSAADWNRAAAVNNRVEMRWQAQR